MTDNARCPHCHQDFSEYGLELADHYFGDKWLCQSASPAPESSVAAAEEQLQEALALIRNCQRELHELERQLLDTLRWALDLHLPPKPSNLKVTR